MGRYDRYIRACESEASGNHGIISRARAVELGLSADVITRLLRSGRWIRIFPKVYVIAGSPITWWTRLAAAQAWGGKESLISHRSAAALLELDAVPQGHIELTMPVGLCEPGIEVHRVQRADMPRSIFRKGLRITCVERTLHDLFAVIHPREAELALEDALRRRLTTINRLWDANAARSRSGRNGARAFRECLLAHDDRDGTLQSRMESGLCRITKGLPGPGAQPQFEVVAAANRYYIDFAYPHVRLGIEAQSLKWHMGRVRWQYDLVRDRRLKSVGWTLLYFSWDDIRLDPKGVAEEVLRVRTALELTLF